jgi:hypothetical protein
MRRAPNTLSRLRTLALGLGAAALLFLTTGCPDGGAEEVGEEIDEAVEDVEEAADDLIDDSEDAVDSTDP